jgi:hypothetical protein
MHTDAYKLAPERDEVKCSPNGKNRGDIGADEKIIGPGLDLDS